MRPDWFCSAVVLAGLAAPALHAGEEPLAGSPGNRGSVAVVEDRCPTFSWGVKSSVEQWRLAVYRVVGRSEPAASEPPVLSERLPGSFHSWTPSLERCLERGQTYAWSIGAVSGNGRTRWSEPRLFRVPERSAMEIAEALEVVRRHLETKAKASGNPTTGRPLAGAKGPEPAPASLPPDASPEAAPASSAPLPDSRLQLDGNARLHGFRPVIRLENEFSSSQAWDLTSTELGFFMVNETAGGGTPFSVLNTAPTGALQVEAGGISVLGTLSCNGCVGSVSVQDGSLQGVDIADNSITGLDISDGSISGADILDDSIEGLDIAPGTLGASKLENNSVGSAQLADIEVVAIECDGECTDVTLRNICNTLTPQPYIPIAVNCSNINNAISLGTDNCFGNNDCSGGLFVDTFGPLSTFCSDGPGIDALVHCLKQGSG